MGRDGIQWVMPKIIQDKLLANARAQVLQHPLSQDHSDILYRELEMPLGIRKGDWDGDTLMQAVFHNTDTVHMADGNDDGANDYWQPGGYAGSPDLDVDLWQPEAMLAPPNTHIDNIQFFIVYENHKFIEPREFSKSEVLKQLEDVHSAETMQHVKQHTNRDGIGRRPALIAPGASGSGTAAAPPQGSSSEIEAAPPQASGSRTATVHQVHQLGPRTVTVRQVRVRDTWSSCVTDADCKKDKYPICARYDSRKKKGWCVDLRDTE